MQDHSRAHVPTFYDLITAAQYTTYTNQPTKSNIHERELRAAFLRRASLAGRKRRATRKEEEEGYMYEFYVATHARCIACAATVASLYISDKMQVPV